MSTHDRADEKLLRFGLISLDWQRHRVRVASTSIELSPIDIRILKFLMESPCKVFTRDQIVRAAWPARVCVTPRTVDAHMVTLRRSLGQAGLAHAIRTVRSRGYALDGHPTNSRRSIHARSKRHPASQPETASSW